MAGCDVAARPPVAADSAPRLPGTDPEPSSDVTPTSVMQEGASQEMMKKIEEDTVLCCLKPVIKHFVAL